MKRKRLKRKTVEKVVYDNFIQAFFLTLDGRPGSGLEYASTSGLYSYNKVRRIAEKAGAEMAHKVFENYENRKQEKRLNWGGGLFGFIEADKLDQIIPAEVWALAYAEAGIIS